MELERDVVIEASQLVFASFWADAYERNGDSLSGTEITDVAPRGDEVELRCIMQRYIGRIEAAWQSSIGLAFYHMGLSDAQATDALYRLVMSCIGHGIGIEDDYAAELNRARSILKLELKTCPCHFEGTEWFDLAWDTFPDEEE